MQTDQRTPPWASLPQPTATPRPRAASGGFVDRAVMVSIQGPDTLKLKTVGRPFFLSESGTTCISASGILYDLDHGIVITTGTLIAPFLEKTTSGETLTKGTVLGVLLGEDQAQIATSRAARVNKQAQSKQGPYWRKAELLKLVKCPPIKDAVDALAKPNWTVGWPKSVEGLGNLDADRLSHSLTNSLWNGLEDIAVLQIDTGLAGRIQLADTGGRAIPSQLEISTHPLERGMKVSIVGSPFGIISPAVFHNCLYAATISNLSSPDSSEVALVMMDQASLPGCEGGPIFDAEGKLAGMLAPPIRSTNGTNIEVQLALPAPLILRSLHQALPHLQFQPNVDYPPASPNWLSDALESITLVSVGTFWATGVIVSQTGHLITSAHLFSPLLSNHSTPTKPALQNGYHVDVRLEKNTDDASNRVWYPAKLLYINSTYLDVALLQIDFPLTNLRVVGSFDSSHTHQPKTPLYRSPVQGEQVYALGFGLFGPSKKLKPTVTSGVVSNVVHAEGRLQLIQTSAVVHKGASGGAIFDANRRFLGLITCNASTHTGAIIPTINFSIPVELLRPIFDFIATHDEVKLKPLSVENPEIEALWRMSSSSGLPSISSGPNSSRGSQFNTYEEKAWDAPVLSHATDPTLDAPAPSTSRFASVGPKFHEFASKLHIKLPLSKL